MSEASERLPETTDSQRLPSIAKLLASASALFEEAPDATLIVDDHGRIVLANRQTEVVFGFPRDDLVGRVVEDLMPTRFVSAHARHRAKFESEPRVRPMGTTRQELFGRRSDGTEFPAEINLSPLVTSDGMLVIATVRDISDRQRLEAQLRQAQKMEAIGQLSSGIAHDFNNVLTVIQGQLSLLEKTQALSDAALVPIQEIREVAKRAANLTSQLLTFGRQSALRPLVVDLNKIVESLGRLLGRILGEDIETELRPSKEPATVLADAGMIEQVILNLALNARDAMEEGGHLLIETSHELVGSEDSVRKPRARPGEFVRLVVEDTGCGIGADVLPRIFEPFFTTKEVGKGSGLGLATAYGIVEQHEGWIEVETKRGRGTRFSVYLPVQERTTATPSPPVAKVRGGSETILVVEDEPSLRALIVSILGRYGFRVVAAVSGPHALRVWHEYGDAIDLLLTDIVLPNGLSGIDLYEDLRRKSPELGIVFMSGYAPELASGAVSLRPGENFLAKPFELERLVEVVRSALDRARSKDN